jgi:hypothetical protein
MCRQCVLAGTCAVSLLYLANDAQGGLALEEDGELEVRKAVWLRLARPARGNRECELVCERCGWLVVVGDAVGWRESGRGAGDEAGTGERAMRGKRTFGNKAIGDKVCVDGGGLFV